MHMATGKGASSWLAALPVESHGFSQHKGAFRDAISLRHGRQPSLLPTTCICGKSFTVDHALNCPTGGFPSIHHNEIRDLTVNLMAEVCHDVRVEPSLQPLCGEHLSYATANREDAACLDVRARGFWGLRQQCAFFDVRLPHCHVVISRWMHATVAMRGRNVVHMSNVSGSGAWFFHPPSVQHFRRAATVAYK